MNGTAVIHSAFVRGVDAIPVDVRVEIEDGARMTHLHGVKETYAHRLRELVRSAIRCAGYRYPEETVSIQVESETGLQPEEGIDLAVAIGILRASGQIRTPEIESYLYVGEVNCGGEVRAVRGMPSIARLAESQGDIYVGGGRHRNIDGKPSFPDTGAEFQIPGTVYDQLYIRDLSELRDCYCLMECCAVERAEQIRPDVSDLLDNESLGELADAVRSGEYMVFETEDAEPEDLQRLARIINCFSSPMTDEEIFQSAANLSAGKEDIQSALRGIRPVVNIKPTHTMAGVFGGGIYAMPGFLGYAHNGVVLIENLDAMRPEIISSLRPVLTQKNVTLVRANGRYVIPANAKFLVNRESIVKELVPVSKLNALLKDASNQVFSIRLSNPKKPY